MGLLAAEPVAELEHSAVALRERVERAVERFLLQASFGLFLRQRILAGDEIAEDRVFLLADRLV